ncbi:MAG: response regulator [Methyloprofundus sp.]|nr:response regulator [Methyloprofundus sp.]
MNKKRSVLIVDDDEAIRLCLKEYFELEGFLVIEAINGIEAEVCLRQKKTDYLLLDIVMPGRDGIEIILSLKNSDINIIAMSGDPYYLEVAVALGANAALAKPFDFAYLKELIR